MSGQTGLTAELQVPSGVKVLDESKDLTKIIDEAPAQIMILIAQDIAVTLQDFQDKVVMVFLETITLVRTMRQAAKAIARTVANMILTGDHVNHVTGLHNKLLAPSQGDMIKTIQPAGLLKKEKWEQTLIHPLALLNTKANTVIRDLDLTVMKDFSRHLTDQIGPQAKVNPLTAVVHLLTLNLEDVKIGH